MSFVPKPRREAVAKIAGVPVDQVVSVTGEQVRSALAGKVNKLALSICTGLEGGPPALSWRVGDRYFYDDALYGDVIEYTDLGYNSNLGLFSKKQYPKAKDKEDNDGEDDENDLDDEEESPSDSVDAVIGATSGNTRTFGVLEVGKQWFGQSMLQERSTFAYTKAGYDLAIFLNKPTPTEVANTKSGPTEFALYIEKNVIFFLYRTGQGGEGLPWSDCPYTWWMVQEQNRALPNPEPEKLEKALLNITLVEAKSGIIQVLRLVSLSPEFSLKLNEAIRQQATQQFNPSLFESTVRSVYSRFPTSEAMAKAAIVRCKGGD